MTSLFTSTSLTRMSRISRIKVYCSKWHIKSWIYLTFSSLWIFASASLDFVLSLNILYYLPFGECFNGSITPWSHLRIFFAINFGFFSLPLLRLIQKFWFMACSLMKCLELLTFFGNIFEGHNNVIGLKIWMIRRRRWFMCKWHARFFSVQIRALSL
jgi:hypothetical protein